MYQPFAMSSESSLSKSSVDHALSEEPLVVYGRSQSEKKMSVFNFNFTSLVDDHVMKQRRPTRGYNAVQEPLLEIMDRKSAKRLVYKPRKAGDAPSETTLASTIVTLNAQKPTGAGGQCTRHWIPQHSVQLPEQAKIDAVLKGKDETQVTDHKFFFEPLQLLRKDKDMVKIQDDASNKDTQTAPVITTPGNRQMVTLHTVCAPKTGAIKLTGLAYELDYPVVYDDRKKGPAPQKLFGFTKYSLVPQACPNDSEVLQNSEKDAGSSRNVDWSNPRRTILDRSQRVVKQTSGRE
ncbi:unnamed protein product, partial [Candidula unifasciata]